MFLEKGFQELNDNEFKDYLNIISQRVIPFTISLEEVYYKIWKDTEEYTRK